MKKIPLLFLAIIATIDLNAQFISNTIEYLDVNNVKAGFTVHGDMFSNPVNGQASYEFPKGSGSHSCNASSIWIGGYDLATNNLKVAAQTYRQNGNDYWPGPLDVFNGSTIDSLRCVNWSKIWKVNKSTIDSFRQLTHHTLANTHQTILEWPGRNANGSAGAQQAKGTLGTLLNIPDRAMAPFVDVNNDNVYNPLDGDYPDIKGDQMLFWVFNDKAFPKTNTGSEAIGLEIHGAAYACTKEGLENTIFVNLKVHNWSTSVIDSTYFGLWNDADLGFSYDDYIGYDSAYKMSVTYNADPFDETPHGYGSSLTQTGILMLGGPKVDNPNFPTDPNPYIVLPPAHFTYYNNMGSIKATAPSISSEYYNYLSGSWKDGTPVISGCNPEANVGIPDNFVFPDDPSNASGISEKTCNRIAGDRKTVLSSGPFQLVPGIVPSDITFAVINTDTGINNNNFNELRRLADSAYKYADGCGGPFWPLGLPNISTSEIKVYPNPSNGFFIIADKDYKVKQIDLINAYGQKIYSTTSTSLKTTIDTSPFAKGVYFLRIGKTGKHYTRSILIE